tara:strand:- start:1859 stop:2740 length:882 start_codon:yes stop_codon:yes gene_type:complete
MLNSLKERGLLVGVGIVKENVNSLMPALNSLGIQTKDCLVLDRASWVIRLKDTLLENKVDTVWVLTFPWLLPASLLEVPPKGFINFHFGLLPKYRGIDPVFWQIKNQEKSGGITVHLMTEEVDSGPVIYQEQTMLMPGENYGLHCQRIGGLAPSLIDRVLDVLLSKVQQYQELEKVEKHFDWKPRKEDLTIDWQTQTAENIEYLVNATNPKYGGAQTAMGQFELRILEVTPVTMETKIEAEPGQIVYADVIYGLVVACFGGDFLRITIAKTSEGYMSGVRLFNLGFVKGHKFG